jgi:hypothetical protein
LEYTFAAIEGSDEAGCSKNEPCLVPRFSSFRNLSILFTRVWISTETTKNKGPICSMIYFFDCY